MVRETRIAKRLAMVLAGNEFIAELLFVFHVKLINVKLNTGIILKAADEISYHYCLSKSFC